MIPARIGSKRIPRKNLKSLADKPLILHALQNAYDSECFENVWVSTDSAEIAKTAVSWKGQRLLGRRHRDVPVDGAHGICFLTGT